MIVLAPDDMKIVDATGAKSVARGTTDSTPTQPTVIQDGSVVYWSIESPLLGQGMHFHGRGYHESPQDDLVCGHGVNGLGPAARAVNVLLPPRRALSEVPS